MPGFLCLSPMVPKWIPMSACLMTYSFGFLWNRFSWKNLMNFSVFGDKAPKTHVFPAFFELLRSFSMRNLNFSKRNHVFSPKAFVFLSKIIFSQCLASSASALWFLSGSQCPVAWWRIAVGFLLKSFFVEKPYEFLSFRRKSTQNAGFSSFFWASSQLFHAKS